MDLNEEIINYFEDEEEEEVQRPFKKQKIIYEKHNIVVIRFKKGSYNIVVNMHNPNLCLYQLVDFKTLPLVGELNKNFFETIQVEDVSDSVAKMFILVHDFFGNFGIPQKYLYLQGERFEHPDKISKSFRIANLPPKESAPSSLSQLRLESAHFQVTKQPCSGSIQVESKLVFEIPFPLPSFVEKMAIKLIMRFVVNTKRYFETFTPPVSHSA